MELYYYRARWYDPQARRFISEDPIGLNGGINLYAYVGNNPVNRIDPWGLRDVDIFIWDWQGLGVTENGSVGHVMIMEHNSNTVIMSQYPEERGKSGDNSKYGFAATHVRQGRPADKIYTVSIPNDDAFDRAVADHVGRDEWNWWPTGNNQTHCTRAAYDALKAGGLPLSGADSGQILPAGLRDALNRLLSPGKRYDNRNWNVIRTR